MSLPYRWYPVGTERRTPVVGDLLPWQHQVFRVVAFYPLPEDRWTDEDRRRLTYLREPWRSKQLPQVMTIRPAQYGDDPRDRDHDLHYQIGGRVSLTHFPVYPNEHYPICAKCLEPLPCRDQMAEETADASIKRMGRYETAGVCPACEEVVTRRQKRYTWPDNVEIPGGPPVTFHARGQCFGSAVDYEKRWVADDPEHRRATLSCSGRVTNHNNGTYECTQLAECPGPQARHGGATVCSCPDCHARGVFGCFPSPSSKLITGDE